MHVKTLARNAMVRQDFIVRPDTKFVHKNVRFCVSQGQAKSQRRKSPNHEILSEGAFLKAFPSASVSGPFLISEMIISFNTQPVRM
jgi:hypothetical protein